MIVAEIQGLGEKAEDIGFHVLPYRFHDYRPRLPRQGAMTWAGGAKAVAPAAVTNMSARLRAKMRMIDMTFLHPLLGCSYLRPIPIDRMNIVMPDVMANTNCCFAARSF